VQILLNDVVLDGKIMMEPQAVALDPAHQFVVHAIGFSQLLLSCWISQGIVVIRLRGVDFARGLLVQHRISRDHVAVCECSQILEYFTTVFGVVGARSCLVFEGLDGEVNAEFELIVRRRYGPNVAGTALFHILHIDDTVQ
jgi:hypothetical protein